MPNKKVVLAYSGGLDTCFSIPYLKEKGYDVITATVDTGGFSREELDKIRDRSKKLGSAKHYTIDAGKEIFDRIISYLIKLHGLYQGIYPQMCSDRYIIAEKCVDLARKENAAAVAHGCTAMGNDQVRFDISFKMLAPDLKILTPIREFQRENQRQEQAEYLERKGFEVPTRHKKYTINENIFGTTISGSEIDKNKEPDEEAFVLTKPLAQSSDQPSYVKITFEKGIPVALNNKQMPGIEIIKNLNKISGDHGYGRFIYTGDCVIGIKGRIAFESPGIYPLLLAHKALEEPVLSKHQNQFKTALSKKWAKLVFSGLYYEPLRKDIEKFADSHQQDVSGNTTLKIFKGSCLPVKYSSPNELKDKDIVYAQKSNWSSKEAEGFIKLFGLSTTLTSGREKDDGGESVPTKCGFP